MVGREGQDFDSRLLKPDVFHPFQATFSADIQVQHQKVSGLGKGFFKFFSAAGTTLDGKRFFASEQLFKPLVNKRVIVKNDNTVKWAHLSRQDWFYLKGSQLNGEKKVPHLPFADGGL